MNFKPPKPGQDLYCIYYDDVGNKESKCKSSRGFRINNGKLNSHIHYQTKVIELEKNFSAASYYCEKHAILVHFRSNQKSSIDYLDPDSEYKLMSIYRIYLKLIELTEQAVLWCKLQSSVLLLSQVLEIFVLFVTNF